jgi:gluconate:H+ symporter, GntP family
MHALMHSHTAFLLISGLLSVVLLIVLIARYKISPFIVLFCVSLALGLVTGIPAAKVVTSFEAGVGGILGHIAIVVALGTILGKMMAESGGAERIALTLIDAFGEKNVPWAMMVIALVVGLPVFFEVGFVLLVPIAFNVAKRTKSSMVLVGLPMVAGLSVVHGLVPPHPAALLAVAAFHADIGRTILFALLVGIPSAIIAGPLYAKFISPRIHVKEFNPIAEEFLQKATVRSMPSFGVTVGTVLSPVVLMMVGSWADEVFRPGTFANRALRFLGGADISLLVGVILSFIVFGKMRGFSRETILKFSNDCLAPTASITLLIGAGGGFSRILQDTGISETIVQVALHSHVSLLLLAWLLAAVVRLATGSATVAMATAAGIVAPIALHGGARPALLALATGAGSLFFSHVNDGGFWLVKECFNLSVTDTIKSWSICETIISVLALLLTLVLAHIL